jgi:hypothetical protein
LEGFEPIYVVIEPDKGGEAVRKWLAASTIQERAWLAEPAASAGLYDEDEGEAREEVGEMEVAEWTR